MIPAAGMAHLYGERFAIVPITFTMPWGTVYIGLKCVLMHSDTAWRFETTFWIIVGQTYDEAYAELCKRIRGAIDLE